MVSELDARTGTPKSPGKSILIVTVTQVEARAVLQVFSKANGIEQCPTKRIGKKTYHELGFYNNSPVWMVQQSRKGAVVPGGSLSTAHQAIEDVKPQAIIMCGIAFGLKPNEQELGDILVSEQVESYEPQKIDVENGPSQLGNRVTASTNLLDQCQSAALEWKGAKTHFGLIMSGEKLSNDPEFCKKLLRIAPKAIGGEMEAAGLYAAASEAKVDWIVVKAIYDWGWKKGDSSQEEAARNAAQFILHVLKQGEKSETSGSLNDPAKAHPMQDADRMSGDHRIKNSHPETPTLPDDQEDIESLDENDAEGHWLVNVGLKENPFRYWDAEEKDLYLPNYFSRPIELQQVTTHQLTRERKIWFFGGNEGYGKTALRKFLAVKGRPLDPNSSIICIEVDLVRFEALILRLDDISDFCKQFFQNIVVEKCLRLFPNESLKTSFSWGNQGDVLTNIADLSLWLQENGVNWVIVLIDPSKESFIWKGSSISTTSFLEMLVAFPEPGGIGYRFFLPTQVKNALGKKFPPMLKNQYRYMDIQWDDASLIKLIEKRMRTLSLDQSAPLRSLGQICEKDLVPIVDKEIASLAQGSPRAAVWLANRLVEVHCQVARPSVLISSQDWEDVKSIWWNGGEELILGGLKRQKLRVLEERIYYRNHEIALGGRSNQLLCCLASAKDGFSPNDELIKAAWPNENPSGITEKALSEAIRRMKNELIHQLKKCGVDVSGSKWIKSVRKRGYRLEYPEMAEKQWWEDQWDDE